jgi:oligosaccharide repeat unit polymerase
MVGLVEFLWRVQRTLGLVTYIEAPHEIRQAMAVGGVLEEGLKPLNWLNVMSVVLCAYYLRFKQNGRRKLVWTILITSILATLFMEDRTRFFFALLWTTYVLTQMWELNARKLFAAGLVLAAVLAVQFFVVAAWLGKIADNNPVLLEAANVSEPYFAALTPYVYLTGSYPALQAYLDTRPESTAGSMTFYPAFKVLRLVNPSLKAPQIIAEPVAIPSEFNAFTWLHQFYTDFGVSGVIFGPFTVAFLSGLIFFRMLGTKNFYSLYANGLFSFALTMSFMVNHITQGPLWYLLAVGFPIAQYIARPTPALAHR